MADRRLNVGFQIHDSFTDSWRRMLNYLRGYTWPRWICWFFGHEPTEVASITTNHRRCRCGVVKATEAEWVNAGRPNWWTRLIDRLPAKRGNMIALQTKAVLSSYRSGSYHYGENAYDWMPPSPTGEDSNHLK
jgi:hypothetical protein